MIIPRGRKLLPMLKYVGLPLLLLVLYDLAVVVAYKMMHWEWVAMPHIPLALFGSAIGIVVAFRNQSAYGRWWEARILWGSVVNNSRSWARQVTTGMLSLKGGEVAELKEMQRRMVYLQIAFVHALRQHLRKLEPWTELERILEEREVAALRPQKNVPLAIQEMMGQLLLECQAREWIDALQWRAMDESLNDLADAQGGAERIKNTPMPKQYDYFPQLWFTPLGSTLVGFIFLALNQIGRDLEDPFENTIFDVPLTSITTTIETNLRQILGETELPTPVEPVHGVLW